MLPEDWYFDGRQINDQQTVPVILIAHAYQQGG